MKYAADPLFKAECLGYRAACSSIKRLEMTNQDAKQKEIRSLNKEQEIGNGIHDRLHCRDTRDKGGAGGRTQKRDGRTVASGTAGRYAVLEGHICAMQR